MAANVFLRVLKHKAELVPSGCKKSSKTSWGFGRSGMMLHTSEGGAIKRAMDMKSRLIVSDLTLCFHIIIESDG